MNPFIADAQPFSAAGTSSSPPHRSGRALALLIFVSALIVLFGVLVQTSAGAYKMTWSQAWACVADPQLWGHPGLLGRLILGDAIANSMGWSSTDAISTETLVVWTVRMPRALVGILVGINLAFSGSIFQSITRNEMASPYTLGVSSGAGLIISLVMIIYPALGPHLPLLAMLGGLAAFVIVYAIAWKQGTSPVRLILSGVIVGAVCHALQTAMHFMARDVTQIQNAAVWSAGSLTGVGWTQVRMILPWTAVCMTLAFSGARYLDIFLLGDPTAKALGMSVEKARFLLAVTAVLSAASAVSAAGMIGFVGLIVPHVVRSMVGSPHGRLLLGCSVAGPALLVGADATARLALNPVQLPVGVVTGVLGGGFFLYRMRQKREFGRL